jgi:hypothetical protein
MLTKQSAQVYGMSSARGPVEVAIQVDTETYVNVSVSLAGYANSAEHAKEARFTVLPPLESTYKMADNDSDLELGHPSQANLNQAAAPGYGTPAIPMGF